MKLSISVVMGSGKGTKQTFSEFPISIGRYPENDIIITDNIVSRRHAVIAIEDDQLIAIDLNSTNGTYINNLKVDGQMPLNDGELIVIGQTGLKIQTVG